MVIKHNGIPNLVNEVTTPEGELKRLRGKSFGERHEEMQKLAKRRMEIKIRESK